MTFRNLDSNHDWTFGAGKNNYVTATKEVAINVKTRILSFWNDCFFDMDTGIDYWNLLERNKQTQLENAVQQTILQTPGVSSIQEVNVYLNSNRQLSLQYSIKTIYDEEFSEDLELGGLKIS